MPTPQHDLWLTVNNFLVISNPPQLIENKQTEFSPYTMSSPCESYVTRTRTFANSSDCEFVLERHIRNCEFVIPKSGVDKKRSFQQCVAQRHSPKLTAVRRISVKQVKKVVRQNELPRRECKAANQTRTYYGVVPEHRNENGGFNFRCV